MPTCFEVDEESAGVSEFEPLPVARTRGYMTRVTLLQRHVLLQVKIISTSKGLLTLSIFYKFLYFSDCSATTFPIGKTIAGAKNNRKYK